MSERLEFAWTHTRLTDPDTSLRAAKLASIRAGSHKRRIFDALEYHGKPLDFEQVATATGLRESAVWKRLGDLVSDGLIVVVDECGTTRQGAQCRRYGLPGMGNE